MQREGMIGIALEQEVVGADCVLDLVEYGIHTTSSNLFVTSELYHEKPIFQVDSPISQPKESYPPLKQVPFEKT
jgi:hypothetical protein